MKSYASDLLEIAISIYQDAVAMCSASVSDYRDLNTIRSRVEKEGLSFLTITLPNFCNDFERSLEEGRIDSKAFRSFRKAGGIPAFLQGILSHLFDKETGRSLCNDPETVFQKSIYVLAVRQICLAFKKIEMECTPKREYMAFQGYKQIEQDLSCFRIEEEEEASFRRLCLLIWPSVLRDFNLAELRPKHGPGTTAEGAFANAKYRWLFWHERLEPYFPFLDNALSLSASFSTEFQAVKFVPPEQELPVKVTPVPKTMKGPRIIAIEPCCMQYAQQALRTFFYDRLEGSRLTRGHIGFTDQTVNQKLALKASSDRGMSTIDLSEASDRVPLSLAIHMLSWNPVLLEAVLACRSDRARLPNGEIIHPLLKFASMGSALCFPIEAMYFYTICVKALLVKYDLPVSLGSLYKVSKMIYIYGDDIIVPTDAADVVLDYLQKYNCKPNVNKTFKTGFFRESCGTDAFAGHQVTPVYIRKLPPENKRQASQLISYVATANLFREVGFVETSELLFKRVEKFLGRLPNVSSTSAGLGRIPFGESGLTRQRYNHSLQRLEVRCWVPSPVFYTDELEGYGALQKCLSILDRRRSPFVETDKFHLKRSARYGTATLKRRWVSLH